MAWNYYNYFTEIEEYFIQRRGRNLLVSPLDWCLIEFWKENGIPLHIVLRGIDQSFESTTAKGKRAPTSLHYCHPAIMEAFDAYRESQVGGHESAEGEGTVDRGDLPKEKVLLHLTGLADALFECPNVACRQAGERIRALAREVDEREIDWGRLDRELGAVASALARQLEEEIDPEDLRELRGALKQELKGYRKRLSKETYQRISSRHLERKILERYRLPEFSLLGIS